MAFKIKNSDLFVLPGNPHMLHLATISKGLQEYVVMLCIKNPPLAMPGQNYTGRVYIEEAVLENKDFSKDIFANLKFIDDDNLANDLAAFARDHGILDIQAQMVKILNHPGYANLRHEMFPSFPLK
jgi:hypothetical protein